MKIKVAAGLLLTCLVTANASLNLPPYDKSQPPTMSLPDAYSIAIRAMGSATNQFHCISANVTTRFSPNGEWDFAFYSTNSVSKQIVVEFDGKVVFDNGYR